MIAYLMDTDWTIDALAGHDRSVQVLRRIPPSDVAISIITMGELYYTAFISPNPQAVLERTRNLLQRHPVLNLNDEVMAQFAELRSQLKRQGNIVANFDLLIAATALCYDLTLLTYNRRHFERVPDLKLY
jgi:tRNA(fMet)-specific endonuclease VapC